jgi:ribonucleoside-diphosphate reductase alpha chain
MTDQAVDSGKETRPGDASHGDTMATAMIGPEERVNGSVGGAYGQRRAMPDTRKSLNHKFTVAGHDGYIVAGIRDDGTLGEIFIHGIGKQGSAVDGFMQAWARTFSIALQYGAPVDKLCSKLVLMRFEPSGSQRDGTMEGAPEITEAPSVISYICQWLKMRFGGVVNV